MAAMMTKIEAISTPAATPTTTVPTIPAMTSAIQTDPATDQSEATPTQATLPAAPSSGNQVDHKAKFLEIYSKNPYKGAEYLKKNQVAMTPSMKSFFVDE
jgi:hypothetical protein